MGRLVRAAIHATSASEGVHRWLPLSREGVAQSPNGEILERPDLNRRRKDGDANTGLFGWQAHPDALVAAYDREMEDAPSVTVDQPRRTLHVFARGENGAVVVDLWESEDDFHRMADDPEFQRHVEASDWPGEPKVEIFQVHATMP